MNVAARVSKTSRLVWFVFIAVSVAALLAVSLLSPETLRSFLNLMFNENMLASPQLPNILPIVFGVLGAVFVVIIALFKLFLFTDKKLFSEGYSDANCQKWLSITLITWAFTLILTWAGFMIAAVGVTNAGMGFTGFSILMLLLNRPLTVRQ